MEETKPKRIEPRVLKGFRDALPEEELLRQKILRRIERACRSFGFVPIDTPVLEYSEVLLGKGDIDKQVFRFSDKGGRDVAMRFDLTVPLARFMASHLEEISLPFKCFHFAKVFRGEKPQRGRFREFIQCDFDILGSDSLASDFEILQLMQENFASLGIRNLRIHLNHRGIFNNFLRRVGCSDTLSVLRMVDKRSKIGSEKLYALLSDSLGAKAEKIMDYIQPEASNEATLEKIERMSGGASAESERLRSVLHIAEQQRGIAEQQKSSAEHTMERTAEPKQRDIAEQVGSVGTLCLDPSISRGLDYYTGIIYETFLDDFKEIGSVCSGGRYNNLADLYSKTAVAGVGSSIGLDRLIEALAPYSAQELPLKQSEPFADIIIFMLSESFIPEYMDYADAFRKAGMKVELYPKERKLAQQFAYAEKKGIPIAIIAGEAEIQNRRLNYKNLTLRKSTEGIAISTAIELAQEDLREAQDLQTQQDLHEAQNLQEKNT